MAAEESNFHGYKFDLPPGVEAPVYPPLTLEEKHYHFAIPNELYQDAIALQEQFKFWMENPDKRPPSPEPVWKGSGYGLEIEVTHSRKYAFRVGGDVEWLEAQEAVDMALAVLKDVVGRFPNPAQ